MADAPAAGTFIIPVDDPVVTSDYGDRIIRGRPDFHEGIDFAVDVGDPIRAPDGGTVLFAGWSPQNFGNVVIIDHGNGFVSTLAHLDSVSVERGDVLDQGDFVGGGGNTGFSTGPHLHWELNRGGDVVQYEAGRTRYPGARHTDPEPFLALDGREAAPYAETAVLERGDNLPVVAERQADLIALGYDINGGRPTGFYGTETEAAVRQFQTDQGFTGRDVDGTLGPMTGRALDQAVGQAPEPPTEQPDPTPTAGVSDTIGPFAAVSAGSLFTARGEDPAGYGTFTSEEKGDFGRAFFGDGQGADALVAVVGAYGGDGDVALGREALIAWHESRGHFGTINDDPATSAQGGRIVNVSAFQINADGPDNADGSTLEETMARYNALRDDGVALYERVSGETVDLDALTPADQDLFAHVGHIQEKGRLSATSTPEDTFRRLGDESLQGEELARFISREIQVGVPAIGDAVAGWETPGAGLSVDRAVVEARGREPDVTRREPAMPVIFPTLAPDVSPVVQEWQETLLASGYDLGRAGADGMYGPVTRAATERAQEDAGLVPDGVVGPDTWAAYAESRTREVEGSEPAPIEPAPIEPTPAPLGSETPEAYAVRQFDQALAVGTWTDEAARVQMSADEARWTADTERPGDPGVQLTFPGTLDPAQSTLVAEPGSGVADVLATAGDGALLRTSTQAGSPGSYVQIDEAAILEHYESVDAFVADARATLAIQDGAPDRVLTPEDLQGAPAQGVAAGGLSTDEAQAQVERDPQAAAFLQQIDAYSENILDRYVGDPASVVTAVNAATATGGAPVTAEGVLEVLAEVAPDDGPLPGVDAQGLATALNMRREQTDKTPETAEAVDRLRQPDVLETGAGEAGELTAAEAPSQTPHRGDGAVLEAAEPVVLEASSSHRTHGAPAPDAPHVHTV